MLPKAVVMGFVGRECMAWAVVQTAKDAIKNIFEFKSDGYKVVFTIGVKRARRLIEHLSGN